MIYKLDRYLLDPHDMTLKKAGRIEVVSRDEKVISALTLLVERYPDVVTKDELMATLWPNQVVTEWSITRFISDMRKTLGEPHHIKTVHGRGYRYTYRAEVLEAFTEEDEDNFTLGAKQIGQQAKIHDQVPVSGFFAKKSFAAYIAVLAMVAVIAIIGAIIYKIEPQSAVDTVFPASSEKRVLAVMPAYGSKSHHVSNLAFVALLNDQLRQHPKLQVVDLSAVLAWHRNMQQVLEKDAHLACPQLGCDQVILVDEALEANKHTLRVIGNPDSVLRFEKTFAEQENTSAMVTAAYVFLLKELLAETLNEKIETEPGGEWLFTIAMARGAIADKDYSRARNILATEIRRKPDNVQAKLLLIELSLFEGEIDKAKLLLAELSEQAMSKDLQVWHAVMAYRIAYLEKKFAEGLQILDQLAATMPGDQDELLALWIALDKARFFIALNKQTEALAVLEELSHQAIEHSAFRLFALTKFCQAEAYNSQGETDQVQKVREQANLLFSELRLQGERSCGGKNLFFRMYQ